MVKYLIYGLCKAYGKDVLAKMCAKIQEGKVIEMRKAKCDKEGAPSAFIRAWEHVTGESSVFVYPDREGGYGHMLPGVCKTDITLLLHEAVPSFKEAYELQCNIEHRMRCKVDGEVRSRAFGSVWHIINMNVSKDDMDRLSPNIKDLAYPKKEYRLNGDLIGSRAFSEGVDGEKGLFYTSVLLKDDRVFRDDPFTVILDYGRVCVLLCDFVYVKDEKTQHLPEGVWAKGCYLIQRKDLSYLFSIRSQMRDTLMRTVSPFAGGYLSYYIEHDHTDAPLVISRSLKKFFGRDEQIGEMALKSVGRMTMVEDTVSKKGYEQRLWYGRDLRSKSGVNMVVNPMNAIVRDRAYLFPETQEYPSAYIHKLTLSDICTFCLLGDLWELKAHMAV